MNRAIYFVIGILGLSIATQAAVRDDLIPLHDGTLQIHDLNQVLCGELHLPSCPAGGEIKLTATGGSDFLAAVNACLWNGASLEPLDDSLAVLRIEPDAVDRWQAVRRLSRVYAAEKAPAATAAQARNWGLLLPRPIDPSRPLVVLIHGLDADRSDCIPIGQLLQDAGRQIAYFGYPGDQPIADSAKLLEKYLTPLHERYPAMPLDIVAHSMGGLVARQFVEGPDYSGGVDRLILVAPPNHGSSWARLRLLLSLEENDHLRRNNPHWRWTWMVTEGLGEAGTDLLPGSDFLARLNALPRRRGVRYTIIAGDESSVNRVEGDCLGGVLRHVPRATRHWWGVRNAFARLTKTADHLHKKTGTTDGPVSLASAQLDGVSDFVVLPATHISLYLPIDGAPPAAWAVIRERLAAKSE